MLPGFRTDVGRFLPNLDFNVMSSYTEGLPVILLGSRRRGGCLGGDGGGRHPRSASMTAERLPRAGRRCVRVGRAHRRPAGGRSATASDGPSRPGARAA